MSLVLHKLEPSSCKSMLLYQAALRGKSVLLIYFTSCVNVLVTESKLLAHVFSWEVSSICILHAFFCNFLKRVITKTVISLWKKVLELLIYRFV